MTLPSTLALLAGLLGVLGLAVWGMRRPWRPGRLWRVPWTVIAAVTLVLTLGVLAHLASLLTGHPVKPRGLGF